MKFTLRPATESDFEQLKMIRHQAYRKMVEKQFGEWVESVQDDFFLRTWRRQPFFVVWAENAVHGFVSIRENQDKIELLEFAIDPTKQGRGLGKAILQSLIDRGKKEGKGVSLNVMKTNLRAKKLYEELGFRVFGENDFQFLLRLESSAHKAAQVTSLRAAPGC